MADLPIQVSIDGAERLRRLSRELRDAPKELQRGLRKEIRDAATPVVADVRRAALAVEVSSTRGGHARPDHSTGLRAAVARATGVSITTRGIRIRVSGRKLGKTHHPKLARYLDASLGRYRRWRHPVFGDRDTWVEQSGQPFFYSTIRRHRRDFRRACFKAMDNVAERISKG